MKVLITGSRAWVDPEVIRRELSALPAGTIIVHGACPDGADAIADRVARELGLEVRPYPAKWSRIAGGYAGHARNQRMIDTEHTAEEPIDLCLAFPTSGCRGTIDCLFRAREAGIETRVIQS